MQRPHPLEMREEGLGNPGLWTEAVPTNPLELFRERRVRGWKCVRDPSRTPREKRRPEAGAGSPGGQEAQDGGLDSWARQGGHHQSLSEQEQSERDSRDAILCFLTSRVE